MFKIGDYVVYRKDVCLVKRIKTNNLNNKDYYVLVPINDNSLLIDVPIENRLGSIREVISKDEVERLINNIHNIKCIEITNDKLVEQDYKKLLATGNHEDLIRIIKTAYLRNNARINNKKKISEKDDSYFKNVEKLLYDEFAVALNMPYSEVKDYVIKKVEENVNK